MSVSIVPFRRVVVARDSRERAGFIRCGAEVEAGGCPEQGELRPNRLVDPAQAGGGIPDVPVVPVEPECVVAAARTEGQQLTDRGRIRLEGLVSRHPYLQCAQALRPGVRLAEDAQAEPGEDHEQRRNGEEGDHELRSGRDPATARTERQLRPAAAASARIPPPMPPRPRSHRQRLSVAELAVRSVISHTPLIFRTS